VRLDLNVPLKDGVIKDATRIDAVMPTIRYIVKHSGKAILMSHLGRPDGRRDKAFSLAPVAKAISEKLGKGVALAPDCIGEEAEEEADGLSSGGVLLLENLRFHSEEEENDATFAKQLAALGEVYVNDAFGTAHRAHASTVGVPLLLASQRKQTAMGFLMEQETTTWSKVLSAKVPRYMSIGGGKLNEKLKAISTLGSVFDCVFVGGVAYNVIRAALGQQVGASIIAEKNDDTDYVDISKGLLDKNHNLILPSALVIAHSKDGKWADSKTIDSGDDVPDGYAIVDCIFSGEQLAALGSAHAVVGFGPMGIYEEGFNAGTSAILDALKGNPGCFVVFGGGDTSALLEDYPNVTVSTGGGAAITFLAKGKLEALEALKGNRGYFKKK